MPLVILAYYCAFVLLASIVGGMIPMWVTLTHRRMEFAVSFVAGVMLGVGVLIMLPHAIIDVAAPGERLTHTAIFSTMTALLAGMLVMFFIERFFCFHHHDVPDVLPAAQVAPGAHAHPVGCNHEHGERLHDLSWSGAAVGMTLHSIVDGIALAASVQHGDDNSWLAGFGTFLVILLHKPFDSMTIGTLMARANWTSAWRHAINGLFALAIPVGVLVFYFLMNESTDKAGGTQFFIANAIAFSAGTFLCISLSDLLPELQFHQHDRVKLSVALLAGIFVAYAAGRLEANSHTNHNHTAPNTTVNN